jgi:ribosome-associated protein
MADVGLRITSNWTIPMREVEMTFSRAGGPGGQNVNKVASRVQLRFNVRDAASVPEGLRARLLHKLASRLTTDGDLIVSCSTYRDQPRNRDAAQSRLHGVLAEALRRPKRRVPTKPSSAARERRLTEKKKRGSIKRDRARPDD